MSKEFGNIDEHVANSRGLELSHMVSTLSPSQIDACAQSDYVEAKGHKGFLIGDQPD